MRAAAQGVAKLRLKNTERIFTGSGDGAVRQHRRELVRAFARIDAKVRSAHGPAELLFIADRILSSPVPGPIVECGCFHGASTAKLSWVAEASRRELYCFDSFSGLPADPSHSPCRHVEGRNRQFTPGEYSGSLELVKQNVRQYGDLSVCTLIPGLFQDALPRLAIAPAHVLMDVDYISSARDCLKHLWPRLLSGGYFFTHEAVFVDYVRGITDGLWWHENFGRRPPPLFGAGYGTGSLCAYLAYFMKD